MDAENDGTPSVEARVAATGQLLPVCPRYYMTMFEDGLLEPQPGSTAAHFTASVEVGPAGPWPTEAATQPLTLAAKLTRQQSDYLAAIGSLLLADEVFDPISTLVRPTFEYGARLAWLMDPDATHRVRCTRSVLTGAVSLQMSRRAASRMPDTPARTAARTKGKAKWRRLARMIDERFNSVERADNATAWVIEGVGYPSWSTLGKMWAKLAGSPVDGGGLYDMLSVGAHPQRVLATVGFFRTDHGGVSRQVDVDELAKRVQVAEVSFYISLTAIANYNSYESDLIRDLEARIEAVFLGVWNTTPPGSA